MIADIRNKSDIAIELDKLHGLRGVDLTRQLQAITLRKEFHLIKGETCIYSALGDDGDDYPSLLAAAQRAASRGYRVFILPNPKGIRTADFIFERKGLYRMYDLKTVHGKSSVLNRLTESIGQTNHVLLNIATSYNGRLLATQIKQYFEQSPQAAEVLIFKGGQTISVKRGYALDKLFILSFSRKYGK